MTDVQAQLIATLPGETWESLTAKLLPASWKSEHYEWSWHQMLPDSVIQVWERLSDESQLVAFLVGRQGADMVNDLQDR
jgi:hypothetical protein